MSLGFVVDTKTTGYVDCANQQSVADPDSGWAVLGKNEPVNPTASANLLAVAFDEGKDLLAWVGTKTYETARSIFGCSHAHSKKEMPIANQTFFSRSNENIAGAKIMVGLPAWMNKKPDEAKRKECLNEQRGTKLTRAVEEGLFKDEKETYRKGIEAYCDVVARCGGMIDTFNMDVLDCDREARRILDRTTSDAKRELPNRLELIRR